MLYSNTKVNLYWITFTAYSESGKALKVVTRLCENHAEVVKVSLALQAKFKCEGLPVDFIGYDVASYHNTSYDEAMLNEGKVLTHKQVIQILNLNPCSYARFNDIGMKGLTVFYKASSDKTANKQEVY